MGHHPKKKSPQDREATKQKLRFIKKQRKQKLQQKRAKLIVRNLDFAVTEANLKQHFEKFGEIDSVTILKDAEGKPKGYAFVQFKLVQKAAKAKFHTHGKKFLGRDLKVDFAVAKDKYEKSKVKVDDGGDVKEEKVNVDDLDLGDDSKVEVKEENDVKSEKSSDSESGDERDEDGGSDEEVEEVPLKKPKVESHDVTEGKTIFIKNVPFSATNDDLKECLSQFGPLYYALICIDKFTEHSRGTAFVKFRSKEDAEKALNAGTELQLMGTVLDCHQALDRNEVQDRRAKKIEEKKAPKNSRNLYLIKEGVILATTKAAEGVSAADMAKRLQIEQHKTQMLRNLNMFISTDRLIIHNLPPNWDDKKLRTLFQKYSNKSAVIKEARIMRDMKSVDANGLGTSKEFGFVSFTRHEDALVALRALNNNPKIFSAHKRPIVGFSIENKVMIKARQRRMEKSRVKNPKSKDYQPQPLTPVTDTEKLPKNKKGQEPQNGNNEKFVGVTARPGEVRMRNRFKLKTQAKMHFENLKKEKKKLKVAKTRNVLAKKREPSVPSNSNKKKRGENDNFSKIVENYKNKILNASQSNVTRKTKWYE